jgi:hypothetical protein
VGGGSYRFAYAPFRRDGGIIYGQSDPDGFGGWTGVVYLTQNAFNRRGQLANTVAHEEVHQTFHGSGLSPAAMDRWESTASMIGGLCANPRI